MAKSKKFKKIGNKLEVTVTDPQIELNSLTELQNEKIRLEGLKQDTVNVQISQLARHDADIASVQEKIDQAVALGLTSSSNKKIVIK